MSYYPPSQLIKTIENSMSANHNVVQHDIDPEDELFTEDVEILNMVISMK